MARHGRVSFTPTETAHRESSSPWVHSSTIPVLSGNITLLYSNDTFTSSPPYRSCTVA